MRKLVGLVPRNDYILFRDHRWKVVMQFVNEKGIITRTSIGRFDQDGPVYMSLAASVMVEHIEAAPAVSWYRQAGED